MKYYFTFLVIFLFTATTDLQAQFSLWDKLGKNVYNTNLGGNVGIGTPFPTERLDVYGNARVSGGLTTLGRVGIGIAVPQFELDIAGSIGMGAHIELNQNGSGDRTTFLDFHASDSQTDFSARIRRFAGANQTFEIENIGEGAIQFRQKGIPTMTLLSNGNLGVGITLPTKKLHVKGDSYFDGDSYFAGAVDFEGNVGIGIANPTQKLSVAGSGYITGNLDVRKKLWTGSNIQMNEFYSGDANRNTFIDFHSSDERAAYDARLIREPGTVGNFEMANHGSGNIEFSQGGVNRMVITPSGNIGIGTTTDPTEKLRVQGSSYIAGSLDVIGYMKSQFISLNSHRTEDRATFIDFHSYLDNDSGYESRMIRHGGANGNLQLVNNGTGNMIFQQGGGTMTLSKDGNLDLHGNINTGQYVSVNKGRGTRHSFVEFFSSTNTPDTHDARIYRAEGQNGTFYIQNTGSGGMGFTMNGEQSLVIKENGYVGIGVDNPSQKLHVDQGARFSDGPLAIDITSYTNPISNKKSFGIVPKALGDVSEEHLFINGDAAFPWTATHSEEFSAASSLNYIAYSDKRLKSNIKPLTNALAIISRLNAKIYDKDINPIVDHSRQSKSNVIKNEPGFIAQEVERIIPEIVKTSKTGEKYKSIGMMGMIPYLVEAVKELKQEKDDEVAQKDAELAQKDQEITNLNQRLEKVEKALATLLDKAETEPINASTILLEGNQKTYLKQNRPNPFKGRTVIEYLVPDQVNTAELRITAANGQLIKSVVLEGKGIGQTTIETHNLGMGTYFYSLILDGNIFETKQMNLTR